MSRCFNPVANFIAFLCLAGTVFLPTLAAQITGSRQPDVTDWRVFHRNNDEYWARWVTSTTPGWDPVNHSKIGLSAADVRNIRLLAGIADDEPANPIVSFVGNHMQQGQYLLVTAKSAGCLRAAVYSQGFRHFKEVWSSDSLANGGEICQQSGCPQPRVSVDEKHRINILTYSRSTQASAVCDQLGTTTYEPRSGSFELQDHHTGDSGCGVGYDAGLSAALRQAAGPGEIIGVIRILPAFSYHYALVLQHGPNDIRVLRMEWPQKSWSEWSGQAEATAADCFSRAASLLVKVKILEVSQTSAQNLADALDRVDLRTDRCARGIHGECAMITDGRAFRVEVRDHAPVGLTDVNGLRGVMSENPQLSEWVSRLLDATSRVKTADFK